MSEPTTAGPSRLRRSSARVVVVAAVLFVSADLIYKTLNNITYLTREKCILYRMLPRPAFLFFEYFVELWALVLVGLLLARLLERWFSRYRGLFPRNPVMAFLYASAVPVCACAVIPLTRSLRGKLRLRTLLTFVVAAPLLSPYTIVLSFAILGTTYGLLRIAASFLLAVSAGYVLEFFQREGEEADVGDAAWCDPKDCPASESGACRDAFGLFCRVLPYLIVASAGGMAFELFAPARSLMGFKATTSPLRTLLVLLAGVPLYFCNGAEVLFLRPLIHRGGFSMGSSIAFSLTSTSICITSFVMLLRFLGKRLTLILLAHVILATLVISYAVDLLFRTPVLP